MTDVGIHTHPRTNWLTAFERRRGAHRNLTLGTTPIGTTSISTAPISTAPIDQAWPRAVGRSLATFQLGETGGGLHLFEAARKAGRPDLLDPLALFLAEEGEHARLLKMILDHLGIVPLSEHWTDGVFAALRRLAGLRTELFTLLMAEVVGFHYYEAMAAAAPTAEMATVLSAIRDDELLHFDFVVDVLTELMDGWPRWRVGGVLVAFVGVTASASIVTAIDHRRAFNYCGVGGLEVVRSCWATATELARRIAALTA